MSGKRNKWLMFIGLFFLALFAVTFFQVGSVAVKTWRPLQEAGKANQQLEARFGPAGSYTPPPDGVLEPERVEAFVQVRRDLRLACERYEPMGRAFEYMNSIDESDEPDLHAVWDTMKLAMDASRKITPFVGRFFEDRNRALVEAGMGLDQYAYLYVSAYNRQLASPEVQRQVFSDDVEPAAELLASLREMVTRQHAASHGEMKTLLGAELIALSEDPNRYPWRDGPPPAIEKGLAAYRGELDDLFCAGTAGIAMDRDSGRAILIALE